MPNMRLPAFALLTAMTMLTVRPLVEMPAAQAEASIAGTATSSSGQTLVNAAVQLRNLATGQIVGTTTSTATGGFSFVGVQAGNFAVEVVNAAGQVIGATSSIAVTAGATITGVTVSATAAVVGAAAGGAAAAGVAAAGAGTAAAATTAAIVTSVAAAAGAAGVVAVSTNGTASASR